MKLIKAIETGIDCGLETVGECMFNIELHAGNLFSYSDVEKEIKEMHVEYKGLQSCTKCTRETSSKEAYSLLKEELCQAVITTYKQALNSPEFAAKLADE